MTRFHIVSDLHLDHARMAPLPLAGDVLILAGDTASAHNLELMGAPVSNYLEAKRPVVFVAGNHEHYGHAMPHALRMMHRWARKHGLIFLHNRAVVLGGVRIFGATAWTDYEFGGTPRRTNMLGAARMLNDHRLIRMERGSFGRPFTPEDALKAHRKSMRLLDARLGEDFQGPTVILTHHGVHGNSVADRFKGSDINAAFVSDLTGVLSKHKPVLAIHGHVHDSFDYMLGASRVVANPRGYPLNRYVEPGGKQRFENPAFKEDLVIDVH